MACRILLADDSITIQKVVNLTFADEGIEVVAVSNGETAEKRLSEINPDLVLADIFMPGKNGYELCEFIKQNPQFSEVPVVLLVGAFEPFDQAEARRVKADTHLTKPFESRVLVETVRRLINKGDKPITGPLGSMAADSGDQPPEDSPVEEIGSAEYSLETRAMASPLLNIDLNAMSDDVPLVETDHLDPAAVTSPSGFQTLSDSSPLDLDYSSFVEEPVAHDRGQPLHLQFDDSFRTQQLASLSAQEQADILAVQQVESSVLVEEHPLAGEAEVLDQNLFISTEPRSGIPSAFGYSPQDVLVDFDQVQSPETPSPENVVSLEPDDELDTGKLERPSASSAPASMQDENVDEGEADEPVTIGPVTRLLLSSDNPFDVLFDEKPQGATVQPTPVEAAEGPLDTEEAVTTAADNQEWAEMAPLSPISDLSTPAITSEESTAPTLADEQEAEMAAPHMAAEEAVYASEPGIVGQDIEVGAATEFQPVDEMVESGFEIARDESEETVYELEQPASSSLSGEIDEEKFSSAAMWSETETHFTPIDIEAVTVEEPVVSETSATETQEQETGFDFQPVDEGQLAENESAAESAQPTATPVAATSGQEAAFSPEVIDEIVRRVVAQMSDRVVREIAWEVVPDCVERVIKEMTRDSASKKT